MGWTETNLSNIVVVNPKNRDVTPQSSGFIPMALAPTDFNGNLQFEEREWEEIKKKYTHFANGDIIFAKVTPCFENGKAAIVAGLPNGIGAGSSEFYVLRPLGEGISASYIFANIKSHEFMQAGAENMTGAVGLRRVPRKFVEGFTINLPPLAEQKVIADKLDTLLAKVESIKARLDNIPQILKTFRQSVLVAAVSGKFLKEWNASSKTLLDIADFQNGYAFKSGWFLNEGTYQVIKLGNIRDGRLALENSPAYVDESVAEEFRKFEPQQGDTLISMTGTRFKKDYGFGCLVGDIRGLLINQRVGRLIPKLTIITPEYLNLFIRSDLFRDQFFEGETGGVNQGNVGSKHILSISIDLPDIDIQSKVVSYVEQLFANADNIEQQVRVAQTQVNNLTQSILAKAFRGELTADWRSANPELVIGYNSAESLLERIQAQRETIGKQPKSRRTAVKKNS